jgi:hypothetical protein
MRITKKDYMKILKYYNISVGSNDTYKSIQNKAESILATKLCRCIKAVNPTTSNESKNIAICTTSILNQRGLKSTRFTCKKNIGFTKNLKKTRRTLNL